MSLPARRACTTIQRRAARSAPRLSRTLASHGHDGHHHEPPHPWVYPKETFTSRPFIIGGAVGVVMLGLAEAGYLNVRDEKHPLTRYMADNIATKEEILQENLDNIEIVKEAAADYRLGSSARQDHFKPRRSIGAALGSPHGLSVEPRPDLSTLQPKKLPKQDS